MISFDQLHEELCFLPTPSIILTATLTALNTAESLLRMRMDYAEKKTGTCLRKIYDLVNKVQQMPSLYLSICRLTKAITSEI